MIQDGHRFEPGMRCVGEISRENIRTGWLVDLVDHVDHTLAHSLLNGEIVHKASQDSGGRASLASKDKILMVGSLLIAEQRWPLNTLDCRYEVS
jgi:hypothetical protein